QIVSPGVGTRFFRQSFSKIIIDPTDPSGNTVYAALVPSYVGPDRMDVQNTDGIYQTTDGGAHWRLAFLTVQPLVFTDLEYTLGSGRLALYAAAGKIDGDRGNGIYRGIPDPITHNVTWTP